MEGLKNYGKVERPWGDFERFTLNEATTVKIITVRAGESFSLQTHEHRNEFWRVIKGSGTIRIGVKDTEACEGNTFFIPQSSAHRATADTEDLSLLEISFGDFDENDIVRLEDKYGRV